MACLHTKELEEHLFEQQIQAGQLEEQYKARLKQLEQKIDIENQEIIAQFTQNQEALVSQNLQERQAFLQKIEDLTIDLDEQKRLLHHSEEQNQQLEHFKLKLEEMIQQTKTELQQTKRQLAVIQQQHSHPYSSNTHRIQSMYAQLKKQFQEKCQVLDDTRKELFQVNEQLLKYQKDYEEEYVFGQPSNEMYLQSYILETSNQFENKQNLYEQEIDELSHLVGRLLQQIRN